MTAYTDIPTAASALTAFNQAAALLSYLATNPTNIIIGAPGVPVAISVGDGVAGISVLLSPALIADLTAILQAQQEAAVTAITQVGIVAPPMS
jgi:hypothetical protein